MTSRPARAAPGRAEMLASFADASDALFEAGVIRSDSFTGEIGEFVAARTLGLELLGRSSAVNDATRAGLGYQIKSVARDGRTASIPLPHLRPGWKVLVCVRLSSRFAPLEVIEIDYPKFPPGTRAVTERLLSRIDCRRHAEFPATVTGVARLLDRFGQTHEALRANRVIRTGNVVGDVGDAYACERLNLIQAEDPTNKGYDAVDAAGVTYEIKTRRVYQSGRRISETRRINGLVGKTADVLVVVSLDRAFGCSGMWTMPLRGVVNPKSANMANIMRTPGIVRVS